MRGTDGLACRLIVGSRLSCAVEGAVRTVHITVNSTKKKPSFRNHIVHHCDPASGCSAGYLGAATTSTKEGSPSLRFLATRVPRRPGFKPLTTRKFPTLRATRSFRCVKFFP